MEHPFIIRFFHGLIAMIVFIQLIIGFGFDTIFSHFNTNAFITLHKSLGFSLFFIVLTVIVLRIFYRRAPYPESMPLSQIILAKMVHFGLYFSLLMMSLSGYFAMTFFHAKWKLFFLIPMPNWLPNKNLIGGAIFQYHVIFAWIVLVFVILHITAAIYHIHKKDGVLNSK